MVATIVRRGLVLALCLAFATFFRTGFVRVVDAAGNGGHVPLAVSHDHGKDGEGDQGDSGNDDNGDDNADHGNEGDDDSGNASQGDEGDNGDGNASQGEDDGG